MNNNIFNVLFVLLAYISQAHLQLKDEIIRLHLEETEIENIEYNAAGAKGSCHPCFNRLSTMKNRRNGQIKAKPLAG